MNRYNLIQLGAKAQALFDMSPDFEVMRVGFDTHDTVQLALSGHDTERIKLQILDLGGAIIRVGYSRRTNILIVQEEKD